MERIREFLMTNSLITVGFLSFFLAQVIKTAIHAIKFKTFNSERIYGAGGMPSAHSSLVISVVVYSLRMYGAASSEFAFSILIAGIAIYDAMSVRYNAGLHAKELNRLRKVVDELAEKVNSLGGEDAEPVEKPDPQKELNEYLGHTPIEVLAGALLGILMGLFFPMSL